MTDQIKISIDREVYDRLLMLMVPPISDANRLSGVVDSRWACQPPSVALGASEHHFTMEQELERTRQGVYEGGGNT
jgi:hypothetical protein